MATLTDRMQAVEDAITLLKADGYDLFAALALESESVYVYAEDKSAEDYSLIAVVKVGG